MEGDRAVRGPDGDDDGSSSSFLLRLRRRRRRRKGNGVQRPGPEGAPPGLLEARGGVAPDGEEVGRRAAVSVGDEEEGRRRGGGGGGRGRAVGGGVGGDAAIIIAAPLVDLFRQFRRPDPVNPHAPFPARLCELFPRAHVEDQDLRPDAHAEKRDGRSRDAREGGDVADTSDAFRRASGLLCHFLRYRFRRNVPR